jgi:twinkle protein
LETTKNLSKQFIDYRDIPREIRQLYGSYILTNEKNDLVEAVYPYKSFSKHRILPKQGFYATGDNPKAHELFGMGLFNAGSSPIVVLTEGEEDAMAAYYALGKKFPVHSVKSSSSAYKDCSANYDYLNSFEKIYLSFDNDEPGKEAVRRVASLFPFNKVYIVNLTKYKDANEAVSKGIEGIKEYQQVFWNSKRHVPENIVSSISDFKKALEEKDQEVVCSLPFAQLQDMLRGVRAGETLLLKALEGIGKTEFMGAIEYHVLSTTDWNIGVIHLEEPIKRSLQRIATYDLEQPVHLDKTISNDTVLESVSKVSKRDDRIHFYKNFGSDDLNEVINSIRFLVASCGCKIIFLDHISRLVTGIKDMDERRALDFISTKLAQLADELQFALVMITHVNDDGQTRGSRNISKEAASVVSLNRDILAIDPEQRNTTNLVVEKNRYGSTTGPAGSVYFDASTFTLSDTQNPDLVGVPVD